jgi:hypothetical protein
VYLLTVLVGVLAAAVLLAAPSGFTENATLNARAAYIAGKPVHVYCATTQDVWRSFVTTSGDTMSPEVTNGVTLVPGASETYLSPESCTPLLRRIRGHLPFPLAFGATLDVLAHESIHMRGEADEGTAECAAFRTLPSYLVAKWGFRKGSPAFQRIMLGATNAHNAAGPEYRTVC